MDQAEALKSMVVQFTGRSANEINWDRWLSDYGVDSLSFVVFREQCERSFHVTISDGEWSRIRSLRDVLQFIQSLEPSTDLPFPPANPSLPTRPQARGTFQEQIEIGMPLTGMNNLSETPLLKYLGDLRWRHIAQLTGVKSRDLVDASGQRLYPAFFYVEMSFPEHRPIGSFGENDVITAVDRIGRYGSSMIDGVTALIPSDYVASSRQHPSTVDEWVKAGVPAVRLTNLFVMKFNGAEWLKKGRPREGLLEGIGELQAPPGSYELTKQAERRGHIDLPDHSYVPLDDQDASFEYQIQPDRDVNGVGLLYFANYPLFLDLAEREALTRHRGGWTGTVINKRSMLSRRIAYLNNAQWSDKLRIDTRIWIKKPRSSRLADPDIAPVTLFSNQRMYRVSDGRLMCMCSSRKLLFGVTSQEVRWETPEMVVSQ